MGMLGGGYGFYCQDAFEELTNQLDSEIGLSLYGIPVRHFGELDMGRYGIGPRSVW